MNDGIHVARSLFVTTHRALASLQPDLSTTTDLPDQTHPMCPLSLSLFLCAEDSRS
jgi:hypothetical protein